MNSWVNTPMASFCYKNRINIFLPQWRDFSLQGILNRAESHIFWRRKTFHRTYTLEIFIEISHYFLYKGTGPGVYFCVFLCLEGERKKHGKKRDLISPGKDKGNASLKWEKCLTLRGSWGNFVPPQENSHWALELKLLLLLKLVSSPQGEFN